MKKTMIVLAAFSLLVLTALPAAADLGYEEPTVQPTEVETEPPTGGQEEPTVEPTEVVTEPEIIDTEEEVADEEELADTGSNAMTIGLVGGGLLLAGGAALVATRRSKVDASE